MLNAPPKTDVEADSHLGVSVIVPLLNESAAVSELLAHLSALGGGFSDGQRAASSFEVILVDGGSQDDTLGLISRSGFSYIESEPGRAKQMNAGAALASQSILVFLHADTQLPDNFLTEIRRAHAWGRFDVRFDTGSRLMRLIAYFMNLRSRFTGVATGDQGIFISQDLFSEIGGFPELPLMEDVAICKTLRQLERPFCSKAKVRTSARRWQQNGVVKTVLKMWAFRLAFFLGVSPRYLARRYYDAR